MRTTSVIQRRGRRVFLHQQRLRAHVKESLYSIVWRWTVNVALLALLAVHGSSAARGSMLYWDTNGATAGCGSGNGDWQGANWSGDSSGMTATGLWTNGSDAVFSAGSDTTGSFTVTAPSDLTLGNLAVEEGNANFVGSGVLSIAPSSTWTINSAANLAVINDLNPGGALFTVNTAGNATFSGAISGSGSLTKTGTGILELAGVNNLSGSTAYLNVNAGTLLVPQGTTQATSISLAGSGTSMTLSGGSISLIYGFSVGGVAGMPCNFHMTGGTLNCGSSLSVGSDNNTPSISQSGGLATSNQLRVGVRYTYFNVATYTLSGTGILQSQEALVGGDWGRGSFYQTGGTHTVASDLTLGYAANCYGYYQLDGGSLTTASTFLGSYYGDGDFRQNGGTFAAGYLDVKYGHTFTLRGGQFSALDSCRIGGTFDFGANAASVSTAGIANFAGATIVGGQGTTFSVAADSLVIFPTGFDPVARFSSFVNNGLVSYFGSAVTIPAGHTVRGNGTIVDHVYCSGALLQQASYTVPTLSSISNNSINLKGGITVDGGNVQLGPAATLTVNDTTSGITSGTIQTNYFNVANSADGQFNQSGGSISAANANIGFSNGNSRVTGEYVISGGTLSVTNQATMGSTQGLGMLRQTGGQVNVGSTLTIGTGGHAGPPEAHYDIFAGSLSAGTITIGGTYAIGTLDVHGDDATITANLLSLFSGAGGVYGELISDIDQDGLSTIFVSGNASLGGRWLVNDDGAGFGRWNVVTAGQILSTPASVTLPGTDWTCGVENNRTLWVQHVPEPSVVGLLGMAAITVLGYTCRRFRTMRRWREQDI
jgi:fibronectin-binding autotransporter adhesin